MTTLPIGQIKDKETKREEAEGGVIRPILPGPSALSVRPLCADGPARPPVTDLPGSVIGFMLIATNPNCRQHRTAHNADSQGHPRRPVMKTPK